MSLKHQAKIKRLTWKEAREDVLKVKPKLGKIIDALNPSDDLAIYKAFYPFGAKISQAGTLYLPSESGSVIPIHSSFISKEIQSSFKRRSIPLSLVVKHNSEVFHEMPERIICLNILKPGSIFGLWEQLDPQRSYCMKHLWSIFSGARSSYLLPKITDVNSHKVLKKKYGIRTRIPKNLTEECHIFTQIANSQNFQDEWYSEILFFPDAWMETATKDSAWVDFHNLMLQEAWEQSQYWRNKMTFDAVWGSFINQFKEQNLNPSPYLVHIVKHIILVGTGVLPAFAPTIDDSCGPMKNLQKVFIEDYKLRDYVPTFMQPTIFDLSSDYPSSVYYSMQQPAILETYLSSDYLQSILRAMPEIAHLVDSFNIGVVKDVIRAANTPIEIFSNKVICDYFHNEANENIDRVEHTRKMPETDKSLIYLPGNYSNRIFADTSSFLKGCVRMSLRSKNNDK